MSGRIRALEDALGIEFSARQEGAGGRGRGRGLEDVSTPAPALAPIPELRSAASRLEENSAARIASRSLGAVHPLLVPDLLDIKKDIDAFVPYDASASLKDGGGMITGTGGKGDDGVDEGGKDMITAFGTLSIRDGKNMRFLGASATEVRFSFSFPLER